MAFHLFYHDCEQHPLIEDKADSDTLEDTLTTLGAVTQMDYIPDEKWSFLFQAVTVVRCDRN
jgi:hypothetical protein